MTRIEDIADPSLDSDMTLRVCVSHRLVSWSVLTLLLITSVLGQTSLGQVDTTAGIMPFSVNLGGQYDSFNPATGNIMVTIPIISRAGKTPFSYNLVGNFDVSPYASSCPSCYYWLVPFPGNYGGGSFGGFNGLPTSGLNSRLTFTTSNPVCTGGTETTVSNFGLLDVTGAYHHFPHSVSYGYCGNSGGGTAPSSDSSGYTLSITATNPPQYSLYDRSGNQLILTPSGSSQYLVVTKVKDPDGVAMSVSNQVNTYNNTIVSTYTDTLGQQALTATAGLTRIVAGGGTSTPDTYTYLDASQPTPQPQTATVNYSLFTVMTNFGCSEVQDVNSGSVYFPTSVVLADGETFGLSYETTYQHSQPTITGRLAQITLPDGGSITYQYSGGSHGVTCDYGYSFPIPMLTRTINDGKGNSSTWTYTTSAIDQYDNFSVTAVDQLGDTTTYHFYGTIPTETVVNDVNLGRLSATITCYNGYSSGSSPLACVAPQATYAFGIGIYQTDAYTALGTSGAAALVETQYDGDVIPRGYTYGNVALIKRWSAGTATYPPSGTPAITKTTTFANIGGTSCGAIFAYIFDHPCSVTTTSLVGTTNQVKYTYNTGGHPIQTSTLVGGTNFLTSSATYNANGTIATFTDVNSPNATTQYYYNGTGGCNNLLLTSTVFPVDNLSASQTWNCVGGVLASTTDENGQITNYGYLDQNGKADPLWRLLSTTDPENNTTWNLYSPGGTLPATLETSLTFNGGLSAVDQLTTFDGLGRPILQQTRQAPGSNNFDAVSLGYDANGRLASQGLPCLSTAPSAPCTQPASVSTTYDALNRPLQVTDGGGGYTQYVRTASGAFLDVMVTQGPAPGVETPKRRQLEYDGLGNLASVCELTSSSNGGVNCGQQAPQTGYLTKYGYDGLNRLKSIGQNVVGNVDGQFRSFTYDGLNRLISETNPEWGPGTRNYIYDSDASPGKCPGTYSGDLVDRTDYAGNVTCYAYDKLHRMVSTSYSGPNATTNRYFVYDAATVNGQSMANAAAKMAEAYTATCGTCSKVTDEGFGYSVRGELSDYYQASPNSGGYYHVPFTYWANGLIESYGPFLTEDKGGYIPDGEGRAGKVYDFPQQVYPVPGISYYTPTGQPTGNQPTQITAGCNAGTCYPINYQYDPTTLRMTQYSATLNAGTISGSLTWNPNGSLQQLLIADPYNPADAQTCSYSADDLARIASVNCVNGVTNVWNQNFSYDAYGNLTKQVPSGGTGISWIPGYDPSSNRYTLSGTSYDKNGNLLNDTFNSYTWDAEGKPLSSNYYSTNGGNYTFVYDAFGHKVEWSLNGTYERSYVTVGGFKLSAIGQSPNYSETPLPGGSVLAQGGGSNGIFLADWLGTLRAFYTVGGGFGQSSAHAPFGESYSPNYGYPLSFTGQWDDRNAINTTHYFPERQYRSTQGRWLSPDPVGLAAVDPTNPQTWNRYAYVANNPLVATDPSGACDPETDASCTVQCNLSSGLPCRACNPSMDGGDCGNSQLAQEAQGYFDSLLVQDQANALAAYQNCIAFNYNCAVNGKPLAGPGATIWVYCGGSLMDIICEPPPQAIGPAANNGDTHPGLAAFYNNSDCPHCGDTLRSANTVGKAAFVATGVVIVGVPLIGEAAGAVAACQPGLNTSNYGHVTVYCRAWMPGQLIGVGYDPQNGLHVNVGNSVHIPLWPW